MKRVQRCVGIKGHEISGLSERHSAFSGEVQPLMVKPVVNPDHEETVDGFRFKLGENGAVDQVDEMRIILA